MSGRALGARQRTSRVAAGTVLAVVSARAISAAAPAKGGDHAYKGQILDSKGKVEFSLERDKGHRWVMHFHANDFPYTCPDGSSRTTSFGIKRMKVRGREFEGYTSFGDFRGDEYAEAEGRLRSNGRASGIVTYWNGFDGIGLCESGELEWSAHRQRTG